MRIFTVLIISFIFIIASCDKKLDNLIIGNWVIDTIYQSSTDLRFCFYLNELSLEDESNVKFPPFNSRCTDFNGTNEYGKYRITKRKTSFQLNIESENSIFRGKHNLTFYKDEKKRLLKMRVFSDNFYMVCSKLMLSYQDNEDAIDKLIEESR